MAGNDNHGNTHSSTPASAATANAPRWWHLPFDTSTNFSLLGFFIEDYLDEQASGKKVDMDME